MEVTSAPKRSRRGRVPRQFSAPMLSDEQVSALIGRPARLPAPKPVLAAKDLMNHRLSRNGRQQFLVDWTDESIEPTWEDVDDISKDLVEAYLTQMAKRCPLMPAGTDISWILKVQMNAMLFEIQKTLKEGFVTFSQKRETTFHSVSSASMSPEVFLRLFASHLPAGMTPLALQAGAKVTLTFEEARALLDPYLAEWHSLSRKDHLVSEVDRDAPLTFTFRVKWHTDYDHSACVKCSVDWTLDEIVRGVAPTVCQCLVSSAKQCATFVDVAFKHSFINGTLFNRMMKAATKGAEDARRAAAAATQTTASGPAATIATPALPAEVEEAGAE